MQLIVNLFKFLDLSYIGGPHVDWNRAISDQVTIRVVRVFYLVRSVIWIGLEVLLASDAQARLHDKGPVDDLTA